MILFELIKKCNLDVCFRCKKTIEKIQELSVDHKIPWLDSKNPKELFFDLNNISFSHLSCNCSSHKVVISTKEQRGNLLIKSYEATHVLDDKDIDEIKKLIKQKVSYRTIAKKYNVGHKTVYLINKGTRKKRKDRNW